MIAGATVEFVDGQNAGKKATTDGSGHYQITGLSTGGYTVKATASGFREQSVGVTLTGSTSQSFALPPSGPRTKFGAGQYLVGSEIVPGRYYSAPADGCYWERQKGLGGRLNDIIANEFIGFDAGQWIVEIKGSDVSFETDEECGTWTQQPRPAPSSGTIPAGVWLVGRQVASGKYSSATRDGCYWERRKDFSGTLNGVIANDFISGGGARTIEIRESDLGFLSEDDCGTWMKKSGLLSDPLSGSEQLTDVERNWALHQARQRRP
jgi:hypothetical protein